MAVLFLDSLQSMKPAKVLRFMPNIHMIPMQYFLLYVNKANFQFRITEYILDKTQIQGLIMFGNIKYSLSDIKYNKKILSIK